MSKALMLFAPDQRLDLSPAHWRGLLLSAGRDIHHCATSPGQGVVPLEKRRRVLGVCCGLGRDAIHLQRYLTRHTAHRRKDRTCRLWPVSGHAPNLHHRGAGWKAINTRSTPSPPDSDQEKDMLDPGLSHTPISFSWGDTTHRPASEKAQLLQWPVCVPRTSLPILLC